jgi:NhaA family Na+:H+ antiporter
MLPTYHYFGNAVGSVDYVPADGYLYLHWSGVPLTGPEFRALYVHAHNLLRRYHLRGILADHRAMPAAPAAPDREWLLATWLPAVLADTDLTHYAAVPAPDPAHRLHTPAVAEQLSRTVTTAFFEEIPPAIDWLRAAPDVAGSDA